MIKATDKDKSHIVKLLCEAFDENKSINYIVRQDKKRKERIRILMQYSFNLAQKSGEVFLSEDKKACALILYPEKKKFSLTAIFHDLNLAFNCIGISRIGKVIEKEKKTKANHPSSPFMHLWFLGVSPAYQRRGIGKKMLGEIIEKSKEIKRPLYLETSMDENLPFYRKMKFEQFNTIELSYTIYMLRRNFEL